MSNILGSEWSLSPDGINAVTENGAISDQKLILKRALDCDLKSIGKPALAKELAKSEVKQLVLQIQKIRNISAPKAKEGSQAAPRMLKITLTDGESYIQAIEMAPIVSNEGAPPWVAFGGKIISGRPDGSFKSLVKGKDDNSDSEFEQLRKDAIAEAATGVVKKSFGGRVRQNVQPVQNTHQYNKGRPHDRDRGDQDRGRRGRFASRDNDDGYGNIEEVLKQDCFAPNNSRSPNSNYPNSFAGSSMEFRSRRGPPRN
ncbi:hypothetical protein HUJ05_001515 [Dendroctonus ponderosae]|nr:hypothetical protein HUJ05_001515 [Dendroctonus ponderosae]KAH1028123.1 hypothetical protein HUJ05_001515 [Dendroctonus ponderosae]